MFAVIDADGNRCEWQDSTLSADIYLTSGEIDDVVVKAAIYTHLTTMCEKQPAPNVRTTNSDEAIIGQSVGS